MTPNPDPLAQLEAQCRKEQAKCADITGVTGADVSVKVGSHTILALLARLRKAERVVEASRGYALHYSPTQGVLPDSLSEALAAYDKEIGK